MTLTLVFMAIIMATVIGWLLKQTLNSEPWEANDPVENAPGRSEINAAPKKVALVSFIAVVTSLFALFLLGLGHASSAGALAIYTYEGNNFTDIQDSTPPIGPPTFTTADHLRVVLEFDDPLPANLVEQVMHQGPLEAAIQNALGVAYRAALDTSRSGRVWEQLPTVEPPFGPPSKWR